MNFRAAKCRPEFAKNDHGGPPRTPRATLVPDFPDFDCIFFGGGGGGEQVPDFRPDSARPGGVRRIFDRQKVGQKSVIWEPSGDFWAKVWYFGVGSAEQAGSAGGFWSLQNSAGSV